MTKGLSSSSSSFPSCTYQWIHLGMLGLDWVFVVVAAVLVLVTIPRVAVDASSTSVGTPTQQQQRRRRLVIGVDGGTESIRAACFDAVTGQRIGRQCAVPYDTSHPQPGWAEQDPTTWYDKLVQAVSGALASVEEMLAPHDDDDDDDEYEYTCQAICVDTTCCSVVALNENGIPLRPCLLWMDQRAAKQSARILTTCRRHDDTALRVNGNGKGPISAEWMLPKALWIHDEEPNVWQQAATICEYQDYINYKLTGKMVASSCNAATRWNWDGREAVTTTSDDPAAGIAGRPLSLYKALGIPELADKLPHRCLAMGSIIGGLTDQAAADLKLPVNLPVVQGGPDAFVGMIGLGCIDNRQMCLITGSSHLHCVVTDSNATAPGIWGAYPGAPLPHMYFAEGGQSSTGSLLRWARNLFGSGGDCDDKKTTEQELSYAALDKMAANIPPGADGLLALETFQGSRTPVTDPLAKGALLGLTLSHGRAHIWRALMEAVCFGTRACMEGLAAAGHDCSEIILAGGIAKSHLWLQMHADVTGKPVVVCENTDAPLLGCAILAAVGIGIHETVPAAVATMVRVAKRIEPNPKAHATYTRIYESAYKPMVESVRPISHSLHSLRGGAISSESMNEHQKTSNNEIIVSPSLLACDWGNIRQEVQRCLQAGARRLHVDVFDGVFLDSPLAFSFGPAMVQVIRESLDGGGKGTPVLLDLHMCVQDPARFVHVMASAAPGHCFVFQWEAVPSTEEATALAQRVMDAGMQCGVSINPSTSVDVLWSLLETGLVSVVDVLAVEPGFGGQAMQISALSKVRMLRQWLNDHDSLETRIMLDGGINEETAASTIAAGADILVSGSFLFRQDVGQAMQVILGQQHHRDTQS